MVTIEEVTDESNPLTSGAASNSSASASAAAEQPGAGAEAQGAGAGFFSRLLRLLTCRRRRTAQELDQERQRRYKELLQVGKNVPEKRKEWYDKLAWWSDAKTKSGGRIFVLAPRGPKGETEAWIDMWELLAFCVSKMHEVVVTEGQSYSVVWCMLSDHRAWPWTLRSFRDSLDPRYSQLLDVVHVVHPSWGVRFLRLVLWPIAEDELWDYFCSHERIEFLDTHIDVRKFKLPKDLYEYDKWLDKQAQESSEQAKKNLGGGFGSWGGGMAETEKRAHDEQMEQLKRLLEQKGYGAQKQD